MPVFTNNITQQNQGSASGIIGYPAIGSIKQYITLSDEFNRETLNPTNGVALYTQANNQGTGAATISNGGQLNIATTGTTNDDDTVRASGVTIIRTADTIDNRTNISIKITFILLNSTNTQFFVGLVRQITPLTGLPTTVRHMGCYVDTSVSNNIKLSSGNGSTQTTTDSGLALSTTPIYQLQINWSGDDSATISLLQCALGPTSGNLIFTSVASQTVSSFLNGSFFFAGNELHFYIKTLTTATSTIAIREWEIQAL